jgi:hypothetical protein
MLIANPIYDTVFKYLMKNIDIAKGIISTIIDEEIVTLDFKAQESIFKGQKELTLTVYHLDFIAKIRRKEGGFKNVLIELQKSNLPYDILRFRRYIGEQYKKIDEVLLDDGTVSKEPLPIITIYFLGFYISETLPGVIKVDRRYIDVLAGKEIEEQNDFIEQLTHDSYVIQIPGLQLQMKTLLEWVLSIFKQENFIEEDSRRLKAYEYEPKDELMRAILRQLEKAAGDKELLRTLELEEMAEREYENAFGEMQRKMMKQEKAIIEKDKALEEKDKALDEKNKYIRELLEKLESKK